MRGTGQRAGSGKPHQREPFGAWVCDDLSARLLGPIVAEQGLATDMIFGGGIAGAVRALGLASCPEILIVDLSDSIDPKTDMRALADVCQPDTVVIALGTMNDVGLYRDLIGAGVHDYLVKPLDPDNLRDALLSAIAVLTASSEDPAEAAAASGTARPVGRRRRIVVLGVRGGIGSSTIAANLAWARAEAGDSTLLLDMDLYFGVSALLFDLEPGRGLADALENPGRVDGLFLERAVVKPSKNLAILGTEAPVGSLGEPDPGALENLLKALSDNYHTVVVDLPRSTLGIHSDILTAATDVLLVTDHTLGAARDCIRLMAHLKQAAPSATVHVVASKVTTGQNEVEEKDFSASIEAPIKAAIPFDVKSALIAARKGSVVIEAAPGSRMAQALKSLARAFDDTDNGGKEARHASWMKKFLKR